MQRFIWPARMRHWTIMNNVLAMQRIDWFFLIQSHEGIPPSAPFDQEKVVQETRLIK